MDRLSEFISGEKQYDFTNKKTRYISSEGKAREWENGDQFMWDIQYLYDNYPQYKGLEVFEWLVGLYKKLLDNGIRADMKADVGNTILYHMPNLERQRLERDMPDLLGKIQDLENRVKKLEDIS